jgi:alpha-glucoside transport system permease protein
MLQQMMMAAATIVIGVFGCVAYFYTANIIGSAM